MKRLLFASLLTTVLAVSAAAEAPRKITFEREGVVYVADVDGKGLKKLGEGDWPDMAPDGSLIAVNTNEPSDKAPIRYIGVINVATGKKTVFKDIPSDNCATPRWSPDGKKIAFQIYNDSDWHIGLVNADGTGFRYLVRTAPKTSSPNFACWAADGQSFFSQDLESLTQFALDGSVIKKWNMQEIFPEGSFSSGMRFDMSPDGKTILVDVDLGDFDERKDWDGPAPSIWSFDINEKKGVQLTKRNHFAWMPRWLGTDEMIFLSQAVGEKSPSVYRGKLKGPEFKRLFKNAFSPAVQR
jgi:TolB protein